MGRRPCCSKEGLNRGAWSAREDQILVDYIKTHGEGKWRDLPRRAGLKRCGKSCRLRWLNYLRPDIKRGNISGDEEELIIRLHSLLGNRWSLIAGRLPGRTDNEIKNYWNTNLSKRVHGGSSRTSAAQRRPGKPRDKGQAAVEPSPPGDEGVIRTKASRCTKVFFPTCHGDAEAERDPRSREMPPLPVLPREDDCFSNILLDFNIDELMCSTEELDFLRSTPGDGDQVASKNCGEEIKSAVCSCDGSPRRLDQLFEEAFVEEWRECLEPVEVTGLAAAMDACMHTEEWVEK